MEKKVFIAYDFEIQGDLTLNLEAIAEDPGDGLAVEWPGAPDGRSQGAVWKDVVEPRIGWCDRLLAFADLPNANVGLELGYALARGKQAAIARVREALPAWLERPPMIGFLCKRATTVDAIRALLREEEWVTPPREPVRGDGVLALAPPGSAVARQIDPAWNWRRPEKRGWDLHDVPELFDKIGRVVWIISSHSEGPEGRDGADNAALAILAGYALGRGLTLDVFHHVGAREVVDVAARNEPFDGLKKLLALLEFVVEDHAKSLAAKQAIHPTQEQQALLTAEASRPADLRPLPNDEWATVQMPRFIGRERELVDTKASVTSVAAGDDSAARVIWVHGFGGMGKSWFLRRLAIDAVQVQPELGVLLIDWDSVVWRDPLAGEPAVPADVFRTVAHRLAQVRGVAAADPFWLGQARVEAAAETHRALERDFDAGLLRAEQGDRVESVLLDVLRDEQLMDAEGKVHSAALVKWRIDRARRERAFEAWARRAASRPLGTDADAAIVPNQVLGRGLAESLQVASASAPLLLVLDTCEVLSEELERALRSLLTRLVGDRARVLVLIGTRLEPDVGQPPGGRTGWRAELSRVFREVPFRKNVHFTVDEIDAALGRLARPAPAVPQLAERLHAVTRGVPLAVRGLFDLHEQQQDGSVLVEVADADDELLGESEAVQRVVSIVAERMLYHLSNRPEREDDLADIVALALLPSADPSVLERLWPTGVRQRLRALATRYSLLDGGDLHSTVRHYLRRHWRVDERPDVFARVLEELEGIAGGLPAPVEGDVPASVIGRRLLRVTLSSWRQGARCADDLARGLALALAYDEGVAPFMVLLRELAETTPRSIVGRDLLPIKDEWESHWYEFWGKAKLVRWLGRMANRSSGWTTEERACASLVEGVFAGSPKSDDKASARIDMLLEAVAGFSPGSVPQAEQVGSALWDAAYQLADRSPMDREMAKRIERAWLNAISCMPDESGLHQNLGNLYANKLDLPQEAEREYLKAIELNPNDARAWVDLADLYADKLARPQEAEHAYLKAIELDPEDAVPLDNLGDLYADKLDRPQEAERAYLRVIELDPEYARVYNGLGNLYQGTLDRPEDAARAYLKGIELEPKDAVARYNLGNLYANKLGRPQEAERAYRQAMELDPKYGPPHAGLGDLYQYALDRLQDAERAYLKAIELDPKDAVSMDNLGDLYANKLARPQEAERVYLKAIELNPKDARPHNGLGNLYQNALDRPQEAERAYLRAIELDPKDAVAVDNLGDLYADMLDRSQEAASLYVKALELNPKDAFARLSLADLYHHRLDRALDAEKEYRNALALDPANTVARPGLVFLYLAELGNPAAARDELKRALDAAPDTFDTRLAECAVTLWLDDWDAASTRIAAALAAARGDEANAVRGELRDLVRKVRQLGHLGDLVSLFEAAGDRAEWQAWAEAVAALASGGTRGPWRHRRAAKIFEFLNA